jgi:hypothetical protein
MGFGKNAESEKFLMEGRDGKPDKEVTVAQYFKMELNMTVTKPGLPCVRYGKRNLVPYVVLLILVRKLMYEGWSLFDWNHTTEFRPPSSPVIRYVVI